MKKYLKDAIEWMAGKFIEAAVSRAIERVMDLDQDYADLPKLAPTKLPEVEYHH